MEENRIPKNKPFPYGQSATKDTRIYNGGKIISL